LADLANAAGQSDPTPRLTGGLPLREVLGVPALRGWRVAAGRAGLSRVVQRMNVMEVPDILPWVKPYEFLVTTAYPLRDDPERLPPLVAALDDRGLSGLGIKVGRYVDRLRPELLAVADERDFPIIELPPQASFDDVLQQALSRILDHQALALSVSERVHQALVDIVLSGGGMPEIARDVAALLRRAVVIADRAGSVRGDAGFVDDTQRTLVSTTVHRLANSEQRADAITVLSTGTRLLTVPISAGPRSGGLIGVVEGGRALGDDDLAAVRSAALVAAMLVHQQSAVATARHKSAADLLHGLIGGRFDDEAAVIRRAATMGWDIARPLHAMVAIADVADEPVDRLHRRVAQVIASALHGLDRRAAVVPLDAEVVVLAGADVDAAAVHDAVVDAGIVATLGVGRVATRPHHVRRAYDEAGRAVRIGRRVHGGSICVRFDALGTYRLLSLLPTDELHAYARDTLGPLLDADDHIAALRGTLQTLLDTGGNVAETARRLHFHYNTVRHRLARIETLIGPFTDDPRRHVDLALALQIAAMHELGLAGRAPAPAPWEADPPPRGATASARGADPPPRATTAPARGADPPARGANPSH
jgi:purine catabolism regulator